MTEKRYDDKMTDAECDLIDETADAVGNMLEGKPAYIMLHVLMRLAADMGVQAQDDLTKREFVADCVECLDFWYDIWEEQKHE